MSLIVQGSSEEFYHLKSGSRKPLTFKHLIWYTTPGNEEIKVLL